MFLDRANFGPGKLDGYYGDFTRKALALRKPTISRTLHPMFRASILASVDPVFITYTVTEADVKNVGELPDEVAAQAKLKALPYRDGAEAIAEKFHSDVDFIAQLNPGMSKEIKPGDQLKVPNVEPFDVAAIEALSRAAKANSRATLVPQTKAQATRAPLVIPCRRRRRRTRRKPHRV